MGEEHEDTELRRILERVQEYLVDISLRHYQKTQIRINIIVTYQESLYVMTSTQTESPKPSFRRVLSNRSFSLLWIGQMVSQSGDYIFDVVALWLVLQLTGDIF